MITKATIIKTDGDKAYVRVVRKSACEGCEGCSDKGKCHAEILFSDSPKVYELEVKNDAGAKPGDIVEIQSSGNSVLLFAVIVFVLPVVVAVAAYLVSYMFLNGNLPVVISAAAFMTSFLITAFITNKLAPIYSKNSVSKIIKENSGVAVYTDVYKE